MANLVTPLMLAGTVMSAVGATQSATAHVNASLYNARLEEINATVAHDQAQAEATRFAREATRQLGAARAGFGASGTVDDGLDVLADMARQAALDKATIEYQGDVRALGHRESAKLHRIGADTARREGALRSASAFLSGAGNLAVFSAASSGTLNRSPAGGISRSFVGGS